MEAALSSERSQSKENRPEGTVNKNLYVPTRSKRAKLCEEKEPAGEGMKSPLLRSTRLRRRR